MNDYNRRRGSEAEVERFEKAVNEAKDYALSRPKSSGKGFRIFCIIVGLLIIAVEAIKAIRAGSASGIGGFALGMLTGITLAIGLEWYGKAASSTDRPISTHP